MVDAFQIIKSDKFGLNSKESYILVRGKTSFLRILGADPQWELMTATASEDNGRIRICNDRHRLIQAAWRLGTDVDTKPEIKSDWMGREYVSICSVTQQESQGDKEFNDELKMLFSRFFELYDDFQILETREDDEMRELYGALAVDDQGEDIYLSDGVWLSDDGSLHDRGR